MTLRRRWVRRAGAAVLAVVLSGAGLVAAAQRFPSFGAGLADAVRAAAGPEVVAWAEDVTYDAADRVKRLVYRDAAPKQFWDEPAAVAAPAVSNEAPQEASSARFVPAAFSPPYPKVAGKADGTWLPIPGDAVSPIFYRTVVHPDEKRTFTAVAIVAIDLTKTELSLVAGTVEPVSTLVTAGQRPGVVPPAALPGLLAAFNGGFKAEHGHYGAMVDGVVLLPSREHACTVAILDDGTVKIGAQLDAGLGATVRSSRQTPPCLVTGGLLDDRTSVDTSQRWGAAVGGATVIRRSALGVSADGRTLLYGLGDSVTAGALARAMKAAGAQDVAQLDVNAAYPRFVFYSRTSGEAAVREGLIPGLSFGPREYVSDPEPRDFFYLTAKGTSAPAIAACFPQAPPTAVSSSDGAARTPAASGHKKGCKRGKCKRSELAFETDSAAA